MSDLTPVQLQQQFLAALPSSAGYHLFDHVTDVCLFVKDLELRFVWVNQASVQLLGCNNESDIIGKKDPAFSSRHVCEEYEKDDRHVILTGKPVVDKIELVRRRDGTMGWYSTTKAAILGHDGCIIGIAGITRDLKQMSATSERYLGMAPVIEMMWTQYSRNLTMTELAELLTMSVSQFERQFKKRYGITPLKYLINIRVAAAADLLAHTTNSIAKIANDTGFFDQSHFTHCFVRNKSQTPTDYRLQFAVNQGK